MLVVRANDLRDPRGLDIVHTPVRLGILCKWMVEGRGMSHDQAYSILTWIIWTSARVVGYYWMARGVVYAFIVATVNLKMAYLKVFKLGPFTEESNVK